MDHFEVTEALSTFQILVDNREQATPKAVERYKSFGVPYQRVTLNYGDYCGQITINDSDIYDTAQAVKPTCVIERKMNLDELAMCLTRERDRFRREFQRAQKAGARVYLLVENGSFEAILAGRYRSKFHPKAFMGSLCAWIVRYGIYLMFCDELTTPILIREIMASDRGHRLRIPSGNDDCPTALPE